MQVQTAVITAAGRGVRLYPAADTVQKAMLPFIDRDGINKPAIQIIAEEALESGVERVCVVCAPGDEERYLERFELLRENLRAAYQGVEWAREQDERLGNLLRCLHFAPQSEPAGYGHAVHCAREFVGGEPFLLLLGDHLYVSNVQGKRCAQQLIDLAKAGECAVAAVHPTREHLVGFYGTVAGRRVGNYNGVYQIEKIVEKPSLSRAELELHVPGLRAGHYLCFFGMHVLTPGIFEILERNLSQGNGDAQAQLTPALEELARSEKYLALEVAGSRYDIGTRYGLLRTQCALALGGRDRDQVLVMLADLLGEAVGRQETRAGR